MKYEIDIDLGELAKDWEPVAYRPVQPGESFLHYRKIQHATSATSTEFLIVRKRWHWPEWLTAEWIAMDLDGVRRGCDYEPQEAAHRLVKCGRIIVLWQGMALFDPPPCDDWLQSKRRNPNAKVQA